MSTCSNYFGQQVLYFVLVFVLREAQTALWTSAPITVAALYNASAFNLISGKVHVKASVLHSDTGVTLCLDFAPPPPAVIASPRFGFCVHEELYLSQHNLLVLHAHAGYLKDRLHYVTLELHLCHMSELQSFRFLSARVFCFSHICCFLCLFKQQQQAVITGQRKTAVSNYQR